MKLKLVNVSSGLWGTCIELCYFKLKQVNLEKSNVHIKRFIDWTLTEYRQLNFAELARTSLHDFHSFLPLTWSKKV